MASLRVDQIKAQAEADVGMADPEPGAYDRNLSAIVNSVNEEARLSPTGEQLTFDELVRATRNRLEAGRWLRDHPEVLDETIDRPIFLTGLPRSGTTYMSYLFDCDPGLRQLRHWEVYTPNPPPAHDPASIPARIAAVDAFDAARSAAVPNYAAMHLSDADGPDECHWLLTQSYAQAGFFNNMRVPTYFDFLVDEIDLTPTFEVHKRQLQLLQWKAPRRRWSLKYPNHLLGMNAILEVYPDARFVMTHRDPVQTLASLSKLTLMLRRRRSHDVDPHEVGRQLRHFVRRHIDRIMEFDATPAGRERVTHIDYYRLVDAPDVVLGEAYPKAGIEMTPVARENIAEWRRQNPKGRRGTHSYAMEEFGLDPDEVAEEYRFYTRHFDIPREAEAA